MVCSSNNNKPHSQSESERYQCPKCGSARVRISYPDIECLSCGCSEPLIDFPISWDWHRYYHREYGQPDPGPIEPPEHDPEELQDRLNSLEARLEQLSDADLKRLGFAHIWEELKQLKQGLRYTQRLIPRKPTRKKKIPQAITTEV